MEPTSRYAAHPPPRTTSTSRRISSSPMRPMRPFRPAAKHRFRADAQPGCNPNHRTPARTNSSTRHHHHDRSTERSNSGSSSRPGASKRAGAPRSAPTHNTPPRSEASQQAIHSLQPHGVASKHFALRPLPPSVRPTPASRPQHERRPRASPGHCLLIPPRGTQTTLQNVLGLSCPPPASPSRPAQARATPALCSCSVRTRAS